MPRPNPFIPAVVAKNLDPPCPVLQRHILLCVKQGIYSLIPDRHIEERFQTKTATVVSLRELHQALVMHCMPALEVDTFPGRTKEIPTTHRAVALHTRRRTGVLDTAARLLYDTRVTPVAMMILFAVPAATNAAFLAVIQAAAVVVGVQPARLTEVVREECVTGDAGGARRLRRRAGHAEDGADSGARKGVAVERRVEGVVAEAACEVGSAAGSEEFAGALVVRAAEGADMRVCGEEVCWEERGGCCGGADSDGRGLRRGKGAEGRAKAGVVEEHSRR